MLLQRVITALLLAPLVVAAIFLLPIVWYALVFWCLAALGAWEWARLAGLESNASRCGFVAVFAVLALLVWTFMEHAGETVLWLSGVVWLGLAIVVLTYPGSTRFIERLWISSLVGQLVLLGAWVALVTVRGEPQGGAWVLWALLLVWGADIGAYFAGKAFGRRKLAPAVSPGKTWEGLTGGLLLSLLVCGIILLVAAEDAGGPGEWLLWFLIILGLGIVSVFGDLFESVLKRVRGVKDSGTLLPGHGGVLDRVDSVLAVMPLFALVLGIV